MSGARKMPSEPSETHLRCPIASGPTSNKRHEHHFRTRTSYGLHTDETQRGEAATKMKNSVAPVSVMGSQQPFAKGATP